MKIATKILKTNSLIFAIFLNDDHDRKRQTIIKDKNEN